MKKLILSAAIVLASLFVTSCASAPVVWDEGIPEAETATVYFYSLTATGYNGVAVNWKYNSSVIIPGGDAEFTVNVFDNTRPMTDAVFSYRFDNEAEYTVAFNTREVDGGRLIVGAGIYKGIGVVKSSELIDFIPFSNKN
ncbi:hypothetical protein AGMMS49579_20640 [Spirochaetia bacterium]|nr:hypothetical protein AGMMS49579_20640 [Spirochaetia bacterium]